MKAARSASITSMTRRRPPSTEPLNGAEMTQEHDRCLSARLYLRRRFDRRPILTAFTWMLAIALMSGTLDFIANHAVAANTAAQPSFTIEAAAKSGSQGDIAMDIAYRATEGDLLVFRVAMDTMKMDAPPLAEYDLLRLAHLAAPGGSQIRPSQWSIEQTGHMGHHVRGALAFKLTPAQRALFERAPASFEIVVQDVGGIGTRTFSFKTTPGAEGQAR